MESVSNINNLSVRQAIPSVQPQTPLLQTFQGIAPRIPIQAPLETSSVEKKKDPLELSYRQKIAFGMHLVTLACICLNNKTAASILGGASLAFHVGSSGLSLLQNPSLESAIPLVTTGLQMALPFTPFERIVPYFNLALQGKSSYEMGKDIYEQAISSIKNLNSESYAKVARNFFVYTVNALGSGFNLYQSYQGAFHPRIESSKETLDVEEAKKILCQGQKECPSTWTLKDIGRLYRTRARSLHPDKNKNASLQDFTLLTQAKGVLENFLKNAPSIPAAFPQTTDSQEISVEDASPFSLMVKDAQREPFSPFSWLTSVIHQYISLSLPMASAEQTTMPYAPLVKECTGGHPEKELANVIGHHYVSGTELEKWPIREAALVLEEASEHLKPALQTQLEPFIKNIYFLPNDLTAKGKIEEVAKDISTKIFDLKEGENFWLQGGKLESKEEENWNLYEFTKRSDSQSSSGFVLDMHVYTATHEGLQYHYSEFRNRDQDAVFPKEDPTLAATVSEQRYFCPFIKFKSIDPAEIGLVSKDKTDPVFIKNLIAIRKSRSQKDIAREVYIETLSPLHHRKVADPRAEEDFFLILPPYGTSSSWKVLVQAALKKVLRDEAEETEFTINRHSFLKNCKTPLSSSLKELCIQSGKDLLLDLATLFSGKALPPETVKAHQHLIEERLHLLENTEPPRFIAEKHPTVAYEEKRKILSIETQNVPAPFERTAGSLKEVSVFPSDPPKIDKIEDFNQELQAILKYPKDRDSWFKIFEYRRRPWIKERDQKKDQPYDISRQIERLVHTLPKLSELNGLWKEASNEQIQESIRHLSNVLDLYSEVVLAKNVHLLSEQNTAWALLAIVHHLSSRLNSPLKETYGIYFEPFMRLPDHGVFTSFRREDIDRYRDIVSYFRSLPEKKLFDLPAIEGLFFQKDQSPPAKIADEEFVWEMLGMQENEGVRNEIFEKASDLQHLKENKWAQKDHQDQLITKEEKKRIFALTILDKLPDSIKYLKKSAYRAQSFLYGQKTPWSGYDPELILPSGEFSILEKNKEKEEVTKCRGSVFSCDSRHSGFSLRLDDLVRENTRIPGESRAFSYEILQGSRCLVKGPEESKNKENEQTILGHHKEAHIFKDYNVKSSNWLREWINPFSTWAEYDKENQKYGALYSQIEAASCQKTLQSHLLLDRWSENIEELFEEKNQNLFLLSLFRSFSAYTPIHDAIEHPEFLQSAARFVDSGIKQFSRLPKRPDIPTTLFFVQVARRFKELGAPLWVEGKKDLTIDPLKEINALLKRTDLTEEEKNLLHLHRVLEYTTQKEELVQLEAKAAEKNLPLKEILISWAHISSLPFLSWHAYHSKLEATHFLHDLSPVLARLTPRFFSDMLRELAPGIRETLSFGSRKETHVSLNGTSGTWDIYPIQGKVLLNGQPIGLSISKDITTFKSYQKLFGEQKFSLHKEGSAFSFEDHHRHAYRVFEKGSDLVIQREFEGEWYQFVSGEELTKAEREHVLKTVPKPLIADHFIFRSKDKTLFVHRKTHVVDWVDHGKDDKTGKSLAEGGEDFYAMTAPFEEKSWILEKVDEKNRFYVQFPRFLSMEEGSENTLTFIKTPEGLTWKENPAFILKSPSPSSFNPLGLCHHYLLLQKGTDTKLLVPLKQVKISKEVAPHCDLDIEDSRRNSEYSKNHDSSLYTGELNSPQEGVHRFAEYDIDPKSGEPKALNTEGALFLAYLFSAQKKYTKAVRIFKESLNVKTHQVISKESEKILGWIVDHAESSYDRSPAAVALALRAALILLKNQESPFANPTNPSLETELTHLWGIYQDRLRQIPASLRLSSKELSEFRHLTSTFDLDQKRKKPSLDWIEQARLKHPDDKSSMARKMVHQHKGLETFIEVYNDFLKASTKHEKTRLKLAHAKFLHSEQAMSYAPALRAVIEKQEADKHFSEYPSSLPKGPFSGKNAQQEEAEAIKIAEEWLNQFSKSEGKGFSLALESLHKEVASVFKNPFKHQSLAHSLHLARARSPFSSAFDLPSISLSSHPLFDTVPIEAFFEESNSPKRTYLLPRDFETSGTVHSFYESAVRQGRKDFINEYKQGLSKNENEKRYTLKPGKSEEEFTLLLDKKIQENERKIRALEKDLLKRANRPSDDSSQELLTRLLQKGRALSLLKIKDLERCFLKGDPKNYLALNSHLTETDIRELHQQVSEFLKLSTQTAQMKRAQAAKDLQERGQILFAPTAYAGPEYSESLKRQFLLFEHRAGMTMRPEQTSLILEMSQKKASAAQLMMGGGKTSVIGSNILYYLTAKPIVDPTAASKRIAFFIPPASQWSTLRENLGNSQKKYFDQNVIPVLMRKDDLTVKNLEWLLLQFQEAETEGSIILTTRETIEALTLEYLSVLNKRNSAEAKKHRLLSTIVRKIALSGDALVDEVDLILNPMQETNFPTGNKVLVDLSLIDMTRQLFELLATHKELKLQRNQQGVMQENEHRQMLKEVMEVFFDQYRNLDLMPSEKKDFLDFVSGKPTSRHFTTLLRTRSQNGKLAQTSEKMSLLKYLVTDVLPLTFSKNTGEHYGRVLDAPTVGPYQGVGSPSFTEFGSPWEAMNYHFQTVLSLGVTDSQVQEFCDQIYLSAMQEAKDEHCNPDQTWGGKAFQKLSGLSISSLGEPGILAKVKDKINQHPSLQLFLEANTVAQMVGAYQTYLRSTSQNFASSFSGFNSFSGTTWNPESFPSFLQDNYSPDVGTEGKILDIYLQRGKENPIVHTTSTMQPKETISQVLKNMSKERQQRLSGFIDIAGLFKESDGLSVARDVLKLYENDERIQSVLFFGRKTPRSPMILMALKKGASRPVVIGSTQKEEIAKHGISPETTFVYYDQIHSVGTDIFQKEDAINIFSANQKTIFRDEAQGILRLRGYFKGQDVEVVIPEEELTLFTQEKKATHLDIILKAIDNQSIRKADQTFRSYKQKIDHALRDVVMRLLLQAKNETEEQEIFNQYQAILLVTKTQNLYEQFGSPDTFIPSLDDLAHYRKQQEAFFFSLTKVQDVRNEVTLLLDQIMQSARKCPYLPSHSKTSSDALGKEMEVSLEVNQEVKTEVQLNQEIQVEQQLDLDIDREVQRMRGIYKDEIDLTPAEEKNWEDDQIDTHRETFLKSVSYDAKTHRGSNPKTQFYSIQNILQLTGYTFFNDKEGKFDRLFTGNLLVSHAFTHTYRRYKSFLYSDRDFTVDDFLGPRQKYAGQVLLFKNEDKAPLQAALISTQEAAFFQSYIDRKQPKDLWLVGVDGKSLTSRPRPKESKELQDLLWQVQLFNGNIKGLNLNKEISEEKKKQLDQGLLRKFLISKLARAKFRGDANYSFQKAAFLRLFGSNPSSSSSSRTEDPLGFLRSAITVLSFQKDPDFSEYKPLVDLGFSEKQISSMDIDTREIFLSHIEAIKQLAAEGIKPDQILAIPFADKVRLLENSQTFVPLFKRKMSWNTFIKTAGIEVQKASAVAG